MYLCLEALAAQIGFEVVFCVTLNMTHNDQPVMKMPEVFKQS